jgi:putative ABC transport system permease protein
VSPIWRWITLRHLFQEGGRTLLILLGVALGVAVFVAVRLANHSAMASFAETVDTVAGKANLQVVGDSAGFDETIYPKIRHLPGVEAAAPVVQTYALARSGLPAEGTVYAKGDDGPYSETLLVLGIDPRAEETFQRFSSTESVEAVHPHTALQFLMDLRSIAVTRSLADRNKLTEGSSLTVLSGGRPVILTVRLILDTPELQEALGGNLAIMPLGAAQMVFGRAGRLDRIDLIVDPKRREAVRAAMAPLLPPQVRVELPQGRTQQVENMVSAFRLNLTALAFIALFVSMFLIFNAVSMAVLRRRREIGIMRSLGVTRRQVVFQFLGEALFVGVVGSLVGLALGTLAAKAALGSVAQTLSALYLVVHAENLYLDPGIYLSGFGLGVGMSLLAALPPAVEASQTPPSVTMRQGTLIEAQPLPIGRWTLAGGALLVLAGLVAWWTIGLRRPEGGFVSAFLLLGGFSLVAPGFTLLCERAAAPVVRRLGGIEGLLGARYLREAVARTSVVVAALMVAVGMMVALSIMVGSFRRTVDVWVNQTIRGDLYVEPVGRGVSGSVTALPEDVVRTARDLPGVTAVDTYRAVQTSYGGRIAFVIGIDFAVQAEHGRLQFVGGAAASILERARRRDTVVVSESFAFRHRVRPGETIALRTPTGAHTLEVEGVYYDYSTDAGAVMMDYRLYERLWNERRVESLALYLAPGIDVPDARRRFISAVGDRLVMHVTPNQSLRSRAMTIFDQTFRITYALQAIAILVAVLGVVSTLTALVLQRGREIGVLRAVGALRGQVRSMVLVESALIGAIGAALGCACGLALSLLLTYVINKQFFGWSIRLTIEPWIFLQAVGLMVGTALLAGLAPARLAAGRQAAEAMRVE